MSDGHVAGIIQLILQELPDTEIGPQPVPDDASYPYVTIQEILNEDVEDHEGFAGLAMSIIQVNVWDKDYSAAQTKRAAIKDTLRNYSGSAGTSIIQGTNHRLDRELFDGDRELHQLITRFDIGWEEA